MHGSVCTSHKAEAHRILNVFRQKKMSLNTLGDAWRYK